MTSRHTPSRDTSNSDIAALITDNIRLGDIRYRAVDALRLYDRQLKNHPEEQIIGLIASIRAFGFVSPILIDEHGIVIDGEAMVLAARRLGKIGGCEPSMMRTVGPSGCFANRDGRVDIQTATTTRTSRKQIDHGPGSPSG